MEAINIDMTRKAVITNSIICCTLLVLGFFVFNLNLDKTYLSVTGPLYHGDRDGNKIALMFVVDSTEVVNNLPPILQALATADAHATFFITGSVAISDLATLQTISENHELGNYGFSNTNLNLANKNTIMNEIANCDGLIKSLTGQEMKFFTPPDCLYNKDTLGIASNLGYTTILPTVRKVSIDWQNSDTNLVHSYATYDTKAGDIILLRPVTATMQCISKIIATFLQRDLIVTSVGDLLATAE